MHYSNFPPEFHNAWHIMDRACCEYLCLIDATCVGFARLKNVTDDAKGDCLLETNVTEN